MSISEWMDKWYRKNIEEQDDQKNIHHSASYHSYFEGYTEKKVQRPGSSRYRIEREYTGSYFGLKEGEKAWKKSKWITCLLYISSVILTFAALFSGARSNDASFTAVFGVLELLVLFLMLIPASSYLVAPYKMQAGVHRRSAGRVKMLSLPAWILGLIYLLLSLVWYPVYRTAPDIYDTLCLVCQAAAVIAAWALWYLEKNRTYIVLEEGKEKDGYVM